MEENLHSTSLLGLGGRGVSTRRLDANFDLRVILELEVGDAGAQENAI